MCFVCFVWFSCNATWFMWFFFQVMEEAAQVLEVETVIPMLLQPSHDGALGGFNGGGNDGDSDDSDEEGDGGAARFQRKIEGCRLQRVCLIGDHHQVRTKPGTRGRRRVEACGQSRAHTGCARRSK